MNKQVELSSILLMDCNLFPWEKIYLLVLPELSACYLLFTLMTTLNVCNILDKINFNFKYSQNKITISLQLLQHLCLSSALAA